MPKTSPKTKRTSKPKELAAQRDEVRIVINQPSGETGLTQAGGFIQEAYNQALYYPQVYKTFEKLRRSMPEIVMIRQAFSSWAKSVEPIVDLPNDPTDDDKRYKEFLESDFDNMEGGFVRFIDTAVSQVPFMGWGWWDAQLSIRDPLWKVPSKGDEWRSEEDDGYIGLRRLSWRSASTFNGWIFDEQLQMRGWNQFLIGKPVVPLMLDNSLHLTQGDSNNPEGLSPLEAVWRVERLQYGYQVIHGIGSEHAAGFLNVIKNKPGGLSAGDKAAAKRAARAIMTAQQGNYALWPNGLEGEVKDIPFSAAGSLLDIIKYYSIVALAIYAQQWIALNTFTNTGALASQTDSTQTGIMTFNAMLDGFAAQYDQQIGKRLWYLNRGAFSNLTKRPTIRFSHVKNNPKMQEIGAFLRSIDGIVPFGGDDDWNALRQQTEWMPEETPEDAIKMFEKRKSAANNLPGNNAPQDPNNPDSQGDNQPAQGPNSEQVQQAMAASYFIRESLKRRSAEL